MNAFLAIVMALQVLILWTWFWPASWWDWLRRLPTIGYPGKLADFLRSLIALSVSGWLLIDVFYLVFLIYGRRQPPTLIVVPVLAPFLIWLSVWFFGFPRLLVPPGARREMDVEEIESVREFPLFWLGLFLGLLVLLVFVVWAKVNHF